MTALTMARCIAFVLLSTCLLNACSDGHNHAPQPEPTASLVVEQDILWLNDGSRDVGYSIDTISFNMLESAEVTIDVLSAGAYALALDTQIYLGADNGNIQSLDLIHTNDDGEAGADGSVYGLDSYLSLALEPGRYSVFVSACCFSAGEALEGYKLLAGDAPLSSLNPGEVNGRYRLEITGPIEP